jgi:hypothetical protein
MFPPEKADTVLPIVDRWTKIIRQVNGWDGGKRGDLDAALPD